MNKFEKELRESIQGLELCCIQTRNRSDKNKIYVRVSHFNDKDIFFHWSSEDSIKSISCKNIEDFKILDVLEWRNIPSIYFKYLAPYPQTA